MSHSRNYTIEVVDDGTLDTVLQCSVCDEQMRYNYDGTEGITYDEFLVWAKHDFHDAHWPDS